MLSQICLLNQQRSFHGSFLWNGCSINLKVPDELKVILMRPYLNDRAKTLLARCDSNQSQSFDAVKRYLLQEMRLSSCVLAAEPIGQGGQLPAHFLPPMGKPCSLPYHFFCSTK